MPIHDPASITNHDVPLGSAAGVEQDEAPADWDLFLDVPSADFPSVPTAPSSRSTARGVLGFLLEEPMLVVHALVLLASLREQVAG